MVSYVGGCGYCCGDDDGCCCVGNGYCGGDGLCGGRWTCIWLSLHLSCVCMRSLRLSLQLPRHLPLRLPVRLSFCLLMHLPLRPLLRLPPRLSLRLSRRNLLWGGVLWSSCPIFLLCRLDHVCFAEQCQPLWKQPPVPLYTDPYRPGASIAVPFLSDWQHHFQKHLRINRRRKILVQTVLPLFVIQDNLYAALLCV